MTEITVTIEGLDEFRRRLRNPRVMQEAQEAMKKSLMVSQAQAARYPPAPPASSYVRTGNLGREWTQKIEERPGNLIGTLGSAAQNPKGFKYGIVVKGPSTQKPLFKRIGWKTLQEDVDIKMAIISRLWKDALGRVVSHLAGK